MSGTAPEWVGLGLTAFVVFGGAITAWVKVNGQIAVLRDRSDHDLDDNDNELVEELRRQSRKQDERITELEKALDRERADRDRERREYTRQINELREQVSSLNSRLVIARQQARPATPGTEQ